MNPDSKIFDLWPRAILILMAVFLLNVATAKASVGDYRTLNHCFNDFRDFRAPEKLNFKNLSDVCDFLTLYNKEYFHHSGWREKSLHPAGRALDAHFTDYSSMDRRQRLIAFYMDVLLWKAHLENTGNQCKGFGIYPDSLNPFIHIDEPTPTMKCGRRWGRLGGRYVSIKTAEDWLLKELANL